MSERRTGQEGSRFRRMARRAVSRGGLIVGLIFGASGAATAAPDAPVEIAQAESPTTNPGFVKAAQGLRIQADKGNAVAQYQLGVFYQGGIGVQRDAGEALKWFKRSADQNFAPALNQLASMYEHGRGVPGNKAEAIRLYQLSAARGDIIGQRNIARLTGAAPPPVAMATGRPPMPMGMVVQPSAGGTTYVPLRQVSGIMVVPAVLDESVATEFVVDSGASTVVVPETVVALLRKAGKLSDSDFTGNATAKIADGSIISTRMFVLRQLKVGNKVLTNVQASVAPSGASPLLGQSFLKRFRSWAIDNSRQALVLGE